MRTTLLGSATITGATCFPACSGGRNSPCWCRSCRWPPPWSWAARSVWWRAMSAAAPTCIIMQVMDMLLSFPSLILGLIIVALVGPGHVQPGVRHRADGGGALCPCRARPGAQPARARLCGGGARAGVQPCPHPLRPHLAEHDLRSAWCSPRLWMADAVRTEAALCPSSASASNRPRRVGAACCATGSRTFWTRPWLSIFPGLAILLLVLGLNMVGDGLRDASRPDDRRAVTPLLEIDGLVKHFTQTPRLSPAGHHHRARGGWGATGTCCPARRSGWWGRAAAANQPSPGWLCG